VDGVWSNGYAGVWHLNETGTGYRYDSSPYNNHGSPQNYDGDESASGIIGGADSFDGINDYVVCGNDSTLEVTGQLTLSAWIKLTDNEAPRYMRVITKKPRYDSNYGYGIWIHPMNEWVAVLGSTDNDARAMLGGNSLDSGWHFISVTADNALGRVYFDGIDSTTDNGMASVMANDHDLKIARIDDTGTGPGDYYFGIIDEVRVSFYLRSTNWINAQYLSMTDTFILYGSVEILN
jgi:hypothetical protein